MVDRLWLTIKAADLDCSLEQLDEFGYAYGFKGVWKPCAGPAGTTEYIAALAHPFEMGYREKTSMTFNKNGREIERTISPLLL